MPTLSGFPKPDFCEKSGLRTMQNTKRCTERSYGQETACGRGGGRLESTRRDDVSCCSVSALRLRAILHTVKHDQKNSRNFLAAATQTVLEEVLTMPKTIDLQRGVDFAQLNKEGASRKDEGGRMKDE